MNIRQFAENCARQDNKEIDLTLVMVIMAALYYLWQVCKPTDRQILRPNFIDLVRFSYHLRRFCKRENIARGIEKKIHGGILRETSVLAISDLDQLRGELNADSQT